MLQLLLHHVGRTDLTGIRNCHIPGLHSIMLHDQEGNRVRLYVTQNIDTYANYVRSSSSMIDEDSDMEDEQELELERASNHRNMNLGFHGHRTEVRLHALTGMLHNITAQVEELDDSNEFRGYLRRYSYISPIVDPVNSGIFIQAGRFRVIDTEIKELTQDEYVTLSPSTLHTVHCDNNTSWLVYERGANSQETVSEFYSYNPNVLSPSSEMYQPMSSEECAVLIARVIALYNQEKQAEVARQHVEYRQAKADAALQEILDAFNEGARAIVPSQIQTGPQLRLFHKAVGHNNSAVMHTMSNGITDVMYQQWIEYITRAGRQVADPEFAAQFFAGKMCFHVRLNPAPTAEAPVAPANTVQPLPPGVYESLVSTHSRQERARTRAREALDQVAMPTWGSVSLDEVAQGIMNITSNPSRRN